MDMWILAFVLWAVIIGGIVWHTRYKKRHPYYPPRVDVPFRVHRSNGGGWRIKEEPANGDAIDSLWVGRTAINEGRDYDRVIPPRDPLERWDESNRKC